MPYLIRIPGIKGGKVEFKIVISITELFRVLKPKLAAATAGDNGSITAWIDDAGEYRCEFSSYKATLGSGRFKTKKQLRSWLIEWWPKLGDQQQIG